MAVQCQGTGDGTILSCAENPRESFSHPRTRSGAADAAGVAQEGYPVIAVGFQVGLAQGDIQPQPQHGDGGPAGRRVFQD